MDAGGNLRRLVVHEHHVGRLDGGIAAHGAHGDAQVGTGQHRGVVDAVAHHGQCVVAGLRGQQALHLGHLVGRHELGVILVEPQLPGHGSAHLLIVASEHHRLLHAGLLEPGHGQGGIVFHTVADDDVAGIAVAYGHVYHRAGAALALVAMAHLDAQRGHELLVAHIHRLAVDHGMHTQARHFLHIVYLAPVGLVGIGIAQRQGYGVVAVALHMGRQVQQLPLVDLVGMHGSDLKGALGQGARLVKHHNAHTGQGLKIVGPLHQHAQARSPANAAEKRERHRDDQGARARHHQKHEPAVHPRGPLPRHNRRHHGQQQGEAHHHRRVDPRKTGDEALAVRLVGAGVFHPLEYLAGRRLAIGLGGTHLEHSREVDAPRHHRVALGHTARHALARERHRVEA